ncbi:tail fiber/spike domain-containing protein [Serratia fonticola]
MSNKNPPGWVDSIYQIKTTDRVQGGPDGVINAAPAQLAQRTEALKSGLDFATTLSGENVQFVGTFAEGFILTNVNQALGHSDGKFYVWNGQLDYTVPPGSTPESAGGIGDGAWVDVGVLTFRNQAAAPDGARLIGVCQDIGELKSITPSFIGQRIKLRAYYSTPWFSGFDAICSDQLGGGTLEAVASNGLEADDGELFSTPDPAFMWRRVQFGSLTIEQLGARGLPTDGSVPSHDSWPAFYRAYKIMLRNHFKPIRFKLSMRTYFVSKPIIITSWMTLETENPEIGVFITYGLQKLTKEELPDAINVGGQTEEFDNITAQFIFQHEYKSYTRRAQLVGIDITNINNLPSDYSVYHTHSNRCLFQNCRFINGVVGEFSRDSYSCKFDNVIFQGHPTGLIGSNHIPRGGYNEQVTGCGTSNEYSRVGFSGFDVSIEHVNGSYTKFSTCYSESGTLSCFRFHRCNGYVFDAYGAENVEGVGPDDRFGYLNNSSVTITGFDSAYNNAIGDGAAFVAVNGSQLTLINPNLLHIKSVTNKKIVYGDATSLIFIRGQRVIPGMTIGIVDNGQIDVFYTAINQAVVSGSTTAGGATYSTRNLHYQVSGGHVSFQCEITWTDHTGTGSMLVTGLPYSNFGPTTLLSCISPGLNVGGEIAGLLNYKSSSIRIVHVTTTGGAIEGVGLPASGSIIMSGTYKPEWR